MQATVAVLFWKAVSAFWQRIYCVQKCTSWVLMLTRKPSLDVAPTIPATVAAAEELYTAAATYLQF